MGRVYPPMKRRFFHDGLLRTRDTKMKVTRRPAKRGLPSRHHMQSTRAPLLTASESDDQNQLVTSSEQKPRALRLNEQARGQ